MAIRTEEFKVSGDDIVRKIKDLINEGNIRRITIKNKENKVIAEFPLTFGVVGTVIVPVIAAIGVIAALASECTISIEKELQPQKKSDKDDDQEDPEDQDEDDQEE